MRTFLSMVANRAVDDYAINTCGISGQALMKNAGEAFVHQLKLLGYLEDSPHILILAGKGNNGGDGYVIAAGLKKLGISTELINTADETQIRGDALYHFERAKQIDIPTQTWQNTPNQIEQISAADIIIDALLGTGISGEIRAPYSDIIHAANQSSARMIAVDLPSGVTGDDGAVLEPCISAELTISMGFGKQGCLFEPARSQCGRIIPVEIGFPTDSLEQVKGFSLEELERGDFPKTTFVRPPNAHKYSTGKNYIIAGSRGFTGAALLASTAALRSGAGLVKLALPESLGQIGESLSLETIIEYLPETHDQSFSFSGIEAMQTGCDWADVVAIGPGIGRNLDTMKLTRELIPTIDRPLVIDADALFALIDHCDILHSRTAPTILTPHLGEFKRLLKTDAESTPGWQVAVDFAQEYGVFLLLKGAPSIMATPQGKIYVNSTGYSGMATAGSGDVLTGVITSLWSQWPDKSEVLNFAMYIHGHAADLKHCEKGVLGLVASDIVDALPEALKEYGGLPN